MTESGQLRFLVLGCGAPEVEGDLVIGHGDHDAELEISRSSLEHVGRVKPSVRQAGERGPDGALGVAEQLVHRGGDAFVRGGRRAR